MFRSSLLDVWATRGPFGRLPKSLASVRAARRNDPREALGPEGDTQSQHRRPPEALDQRAGVTGGVGRDGP